MLFAPHNKAIVAAVLSLLTVIDQVFHISIGVNEEYITIIIAAITPIIVWLVPNKTGS